MMSRVENDIIGICITHQSIYSNHYSLKYCVVCIDRGVMSNASRLDATQEEKSFKLD